jgi:hypothetical protein
VAGPVAFRMKGDTLKRLPCHQHWVTMSDMTDSRDSLRVTFDSAAELYEDARPTYPAVGSNPIIRSPEKPRYGGFLIGLPRRK